jgi:pyrimidine 5'-nucleotidase
MPRVWLFDLDNTLHDASASAFRHLDTAMNAYIERELAVSAAEADRLRGHYWHRYGATLLGLIRHHGVTPAHFLHDTHRLPTLERDVAGHPADLAALRHLRGRKVILTNAPRAYAERVLKVLGLQREFEMIIGIEQMTRMQRWARRAPHASAQAYVANGACRSCRPWPRMLEQPGAEILRITTAALAARLEVSEAALYRHFASKAQMFEGLIEFIESSMFGLINQIVEREPGGAAQAQRIQVAAAVRREEPRHGPG